MRELLIDGTSDLFSDRHDIRSIRFGRRYLQMARAGQFVALDEEMAAALCPESDFDRRESALWLGDLVHKISKQVRGTHFVTVQSLIFPLRHHMPLTQVESNS